MRIVELDPVEPHPDRPGGRIREPVGVSDRRVDEHDLDARRVVRYWASEGATWFKFYTLISRDEMKAAIDEARAASAVALTVWASTADEGLGRFLEAVGFVATGEAVAAPRALGGEEERWSLLLVDS